MADTACVLNNLAFSGVWICINSQLIASSIQQHLILLCSERFCVSFFWGLFLSFFLTFFSPSGWFVTLAFLHFYATAFCSAQIFFFSGWFVTLAYWQFCSAAFNFGDFFPRRLLHQCVGRLCRNSCVSGWPQLCPCHKGVNQTNGTRDIASCRFCIRCR